MINPGNTPQLGLGMSPAFTPGRNISFTPSYVNDMGMDAQGSPSMRTPIGMYPTTPIHQTPTYMTNPISTFGSPIGGSSYLGKTSNFRSPHYYQSSSPSYSSLRASSQSPSYIGSPS